MKRPLPTTMAAAVLAAALTAGVLSTASAASAGPGARAQTHHAKPAKAPKPPKPPKADKQLAVAKRTVATHVATKDAALARAVTTTTRAALTVGGAEVLANIAADRLALAGLNAAAQAAATVADVALIGDQVKAVRPETYSVVVNGLRQAARFTALVAVNDEGIAALSAAVDAKALEGYDVAAVRETLATAGLANEEAATSAAAAVEKGVLLTAFSAVVDREAFSADVAAAGASLELVEVLLGLAEDALAAMIPVEEPVVEEPVVEQPIA